MLMLILMLNLIAKMTNPKPQSTGSCTDGHVCVPYSVALFTHKLNRTLSVFSYMCHKFR